MRLLSNGLLPMFCFVTAATVTAAAPDIQQRAPSIVCPFSDQAEPSKFQAGESVPIPADQQPLAAQIAFYHAEHSPGVFAPKGWSCRAWSGSNGTFLAVTPQRISPPFYPLPTITGPAVTIDSWDATSSGRFHVAIIAAQLFAADGGEFSARVRQEHLISDASFNAVHSPDDDLRYLSDRIVEFTTAANRKGLGTDSMLESANWPIRGLITLDLKNESSALTEIRVRLPANLTAVADAIVQLETVCVQLQQGCRGLQ
jgi:hypothetical protein